MATELAGIAKEKMEKTIESFRSDPGSAASGLCEEPVGSGAAERDDEAEHPVFRLRGVSHDGGTCGMLGAPGARSFNGQVAFFRALSLHHVPVLRLLADPRHEPADGDSTGEERPVPEAGDPEKEQPGNVRE